MFRDLFQKKRRYATIPTDRVDTPVPEVERPKIEVPEGLMNKCKKCGTIQYSKELEKNLKVCSICNYHMRLNALERIAITLDENTFVEYDQNMISEDPLTFPGYPEKLAKQREKSGLNEAVVTGQGELGGHRVVIAVMSCDFFTGSMGSVVGEKITRAIEKATENHWPLLIFSTSGGARMQESIFSLMQMAKTSAALARLHENKGLFLSIFTDPTMGGVSASFAMLGDINLAEPGAIVGFAGRIVIEQTIRQKLPEDFQTAEFNLAHGQIDLVIPRKEMREKLIRLLSLHVKPEKEGKLHG